MQELETAIDFVNAIRQFADAVLLIPWLIGGLVVAVVVFVLGAELREKTRYGQR